MKNPPVKKPRTIGRISDAEWNRLKRAAKRAGKSFTQWALVHLAAAANAERKLIEFEVNHE